MKTYIYRVFKNGRLIATRENWAHFKGEENRFLEVFKKERGLENETDITIEAVPAITLEGYDYMKELVSDITAKIESMDENGDFSESLKADEDSTIRYTIATCKDDDDITGGESLYYFGDEEKAKAAIFQNLPLLEKAWFDGADAEDADDDRKAALTEFILHGQFEYLDVKIRQYLLPEAVKKAVEEYKKSCQFSK